MVIEDRLPETGLQVSVMGSHPEVSLVGLPLPEQFELCAVTCTFHVPSV